MDFFRNGQWNMKKYNNIFSDIEFIHFSFKDKIKLCIDLFKQKGFSTQYTMQEWCEDVLEEEMESDRDE